LKPVVVTGATGLLGSNLVVALVHRGFRVRALRRSPSSAPHLAQLGADWHDAALSDPAGALDAVIVNPGFMFGPMDHRPSSGQLILEVAAGRTPGWTSGGNNFVDVRDVANGIISALERGRRGERYILGGQNLSYRQILTVVADAVGVRPPSFAVPHAVAVVAGLAGDLTERVTGAPTRLNTATVRYAYCAGMRFSSAKAARELGYRHGPVKTAIEDAVAWLRAARMLRVPPSVNTPQN
jgi:dihydroflavonol-4-reductase